MRKVLNLINGPRTLENGKVFWILVGIVCIIVIVDPFFGSAFGASNYSLFFLYVPLVLGLSLLWGFDGVLSFGQMAFFGIGGYTYGVVAINLAPNGGILTLVAALVGLIIAAVLAALSGVLCTAWGNYIDPSQLDLSRAALPVIWVAVGGRRSLTAVFLSTVLLGWLTDQLSVSGSQYALVVNGALLLAVMLFFPAGIFYTIARRLQQRRQPQAVQPAPAAPRGPMQVQK